MAITAGRRKIHQACTAPVTNRTSASTAETGTAAAASRWPTVLLCDGTAACCCCCCGTAGAAAPAANGKAKPRKRSGGKGGAAASGDAVTAPMQGTIVKIAVEDGQTVEAGELVVVLEAMKMENPVTAHKSGTITAIGVSQGETVTQGSAICEIKD